MEEKHWYRDNRKMGEKKSFILYFDNLNLLRILPMEQRGLLITAVGEFAMAVADDPEFEWKAIAETYPEMEDNTVFVMQFICGCIARDTETWNLQREARIRRREEKLRRQQEGEA